MGLEQSIKSTLAGDTTVNTLVGGRIRPLAAAQSDAPPYITYHLTANDRLMTFGGPSAYGTATVEIGIFASTYAATVALSAEVKRVLSGIQRTTDTVRLTSFFESEDDIDAGNVPGTETPIYWRTQTYRVLHRALS